MNTIPDDDERILEAIDALEDSVDTLQALHIGDIPQARTDKINEQILRANDLACELRGKDLGANAAETHTEGDR